MSLSPETTISQIKKDADAEFSVPADFSFFSPFLGYYVKQTLEIDGEVYLSRTKGTVSGLLIYDDFEKTGTIFTRSKEIFDYFYQLKKPFDYLFAELKTTEHPAESYDIYSIDLAESSVDHKFKHEIRMAGKEDVDDLERFMVVNNPGMNGKWVRVALSDGEKCFMVRLKDEIAGVGWAAVANNTGNLHSLYVTRQYRNMGIGEDLLHARLFWLKSKGVRSAFSEIGQTNHTSAKVALKAEMKASGLIYQYFADESEKQGEASLT